MEAGFLPRAAAVLPGRLAMKASGRKLPLHVLALSLAPLCRDDERERGARSSSALVGGVAAAAAEAAAWAETAGAAASLRGCTEVVAGA